MGKTVVTSECDDKNPCPLHDGWKQVREELNRTLHSRTLTELTQARRRKRLAEAQQEVRLWSEAGE